MGEDIALAEQDFQILLADVDVTGGGLHQNFKTHETALLF
jgi:hypothetical protein